MRNPRYGLRISFCYQAYYLHKKQKILSQSYDRSWIYREVTRIRKRRNIGGAASFLITLSCLFQRVIFHEQIFASKDKLPNKKITFYPANLYIPSMLNETGLRTDFQNIFHVDPKTKYNKNDYCHPFRAD